MTTTFRSAIAAEIGWTWQDHVGQSPIVDSNRHAFQQSLADGSGLDQCDAVWHVQDQPLPAGQSTILNLDLLEQTLFGNAIVIPLAKVKAILIENRSEAAGGYLLVGGAPVDAWSAPFGAAGDTIRVMPQSPLLLANTHDGWPLDAGAALRLAAVGQDVIYSVAILGTLADSSSSGSGD